MSARLDSWFDFSVELNVGRSLEWTVCWFLHVAGGVYRTGPGG